MRVETTFLRNFLPFKNGPFIMTGSYFWNIVAFVFLLFSFEDRKLISQLLALANICRRFGSLVLKREEFIEL
jgi:hypothetical protein